MKGIGGSVVTLLSIADWFSVRSLISFFVQQILMGNAAVVGSCRVHARQ
jgi:hypothetical protein